MKTKLDVLVWGATSSTGRLVAEYLLRTYGVDKSLRWGLAGRNIEKVKAVREELCRISSDAQSLPILIAEANDSRSLDEMVSQTRVVASTVGPYAIYGRELVGACARGGVDYCDLTGEVLFIREMIDLHHEEATKTGARIVHCCGFDSIPSDIGVMMMQEAMRERYGKRCTQVKYFVTGMRGGLGGGTLASALHQFDQAKSKEAKRILTRPYSLNPDSSEKGPDGFDSLDARWDDDLPGWTGPFIMAQVNSRIVRRSNALGKYPYGKDFRYSEAIAFGTGAKGWIRAKALSLGLKASVMGLLLSPVRAIAKRFGPAPGTGPSPETRERGFFKIFLVGIGENHTKIKGTVAGTSDPGHGETAKMLGESAVCLALDATPGIKQGGVLTPATALGPRLMARLRTAGMTFEVEA
jgi:short subunit dehydrogenase-like uncharacterized protein